MLINLYDSFAVIAAIGSYMLFRKNSFRKFVKLLFFGTFDNSKDLNLLLLLGQHKSFKYGIKVNFMRSQEVSSKSVKNVLKQLQNARCTESFVKYVEDKLKCL